MLGLAAVALPVPYVVDSPGPAINTIGTFRDQRLIEVSGHETYPTSGELALTTVYLSGGPGKNLSFFQALTAWVDPDQDVTPRELMYPRGTSGAAVQQQSEQAMASSQEAAVAAALGQLGIAYGQELHVEGVAEGAPAAGSLEDGDILRSVNGRAITDISVLREALQDSAGAPVRLEIERRGEPVSVSVPARPAADGQYQLGIYLSTDFEFPFEVRIQLDNVGGPSAGLMFALGIMDTLTPGEMTGGRNIAGTGTIDAAGNVGPIGGIPQKLQGARAEGAEYFLAPQANCQQAAGRVPEGLTVIGVATLADAEAALRSIAAGGDPAELPGCGP